MISCGKIKTFQYNISITADEEILELYSILITHKSNSMLASKITSDLEKEFTYLRPKTNED